MVSIDLDRLERRARTAYELGRLKRALVGFAPAMVLAAMAISIGGRPSFTAPFAVALFAAGVAALWYGRDPKRAVLPGVVAGLVPVVLTLCAMHVGHLCLGDHCTSVCLAACIVGGVGAGVAVAYVGLKRKQGVRYWLAASLLAVLTGSMGCACLGYSGLAGLGLGYILGVVPGSIAQLARRARR
jgi:hypothetical protein